MCQRGINPLTSVRKMTFVHAMRCDSRKVRSGRDLKEGAMS
jgi:hypothetical protein